MMSKKPIKAPTGARQIWNWEQRRDLKTSMKFLPRVAGTAALAENQKILVEILNFKNSAENCQKFVKILAEFLEINFGTYFFYI